VGLLGNAGVTAVLEVPGALMPRTVFDSVWYFSAFIEDFAGGAPEHPLSLRRRKELNLGAPDLGIA
jgi:hypothetical protein